MPRVSTATFAPDFTRAAFTRHRAALMDGLAAAGILDSFLCQCDNPLCRNNSVDTLEVQHTLGLLASRVSPPAQGAAAPHHELAAFREQETLMRLTGVREAVLTFGLDGRWFRSEGCACGSPRCGNASLATASTYWLASEVCHSMHSLAGCSHMGPRSVPHLLENSVARDQLRDRNLRVLRAWGERVRERATPETLATAARRAVSLLRSRWMGDANGLLAHGVDTLWGGVTVSNAELGSLGVWDTLDMTFALHLNAGAPDLIGQVPPSMRMEYGYATSLAAHVILALDFTHPLVTDGVYRPFDDLAPLPLLLGDAAVMTAPSFDLPEIVRVAIERPRDAAAPGDRIPWGAVT